MKLHIHSQTSLEVDDQLNPTLYLALFIHDVINVIKINPY